MFHIKLIIIQLMFIPQGNFVIGNTKDTAGIFYLIDFGLCKRLPPINERIIQVFP